MVKRVEHCSSSQCPIACTLDIVGDHWTLLVIRELMFTENHQYKDLLAMPEGISSNILSDRLKKLESENIITSANKLGNRRDKLYYLTEKGKGLIFILLEIARWADLNLEDRIDIPTEKRVLLDNPPEDVARMIFAQLESWEQENITG